MEEDADPTGWRCGHCGRAELVRRDRFEPTSQNVSALYALGATFGGMFGGPIGLVLGVGLVALVRWILAYLSRRRGSVGKRREASEQK